MSIILDQAFAAEMSLAKRSFMSGECDEAFHHLERAHIMGQRQTWRHVVVHGWMLRIGWAQRSPREILGQLFRIPAALLFSRLWVPLGNTGGANVSAFRSMPLPADIGAIMKGE